MAHIITEICSGCTICSKMCPVSAISGQAKNRHYIKAIRCVDCGVCGRVCPVGAVLDANGQVVARVPRKEWPKPVINQALCSACAICVDACGKRALTISLPLSKGDLNVYALLSNEKACVSCGICAEECPMQAIRMEAVV